MNYVQLTDYKTSLPVLVNLDNVIRASQFSDRLGRQDSLHIGTRFDTIASSSHGDAIFTVDVRESVEDIIKLLTENAEDET
jgi:hypothetical protein